MFSEYFLNKISHLKNILFGCGVSFERFSFVWLRTKKLIRIVIILEQTNNIYIYRWAMLDHACASGLVMTFLLQIFLPSFAFCEIKNTQNLIVYNQY